MAARTFMNISSCRSFDLIHSPQGELKAVFLLQNNLVELYSLNPSVPASQPVRTSRITIGGHRSDVRTLSFSSDNIAVLSGAAESIKIWNRCVKGCFLPFELVGSTLDECLFLGPQIQFPQNVSSVHFNCRPVEFREGKLPF